MFIFYKIHKQFSVRVPPLHTEGVKTALIVHKHIGIKINSTYMYVLPYLIKYISHFTQQQKKIFWKIFL